MFVTLYNLLTGKKRYKKTIYKKAILISPSIDGPQHFILLLPLEW